MLGRAEPCDLALDRREQPPALRELAFDLRLLGGEACDEAALLGMLVGELALLFAHELAERDHLGEHLGVLVGDAVDGVEIAEEVVEAPRTEQHVERRVLVVGRVERDEPGGQALLSMLEVAARDREIVAVHLLVVLDLAEPVPRPVVRLDLQPELLVDLVDLGEHGLGLRLLRADRRVGGRRAYDQQSGREADEQQWRLSRPGSNAALRGPLAGAPVCAGASQTSTLPTAPDSRNREPATKLLKSYQYYAVPAGIRPGLW